MWTVKERFRIVDHTICLLVILLFSSFTLGKYKTAFKHDICQGQAVVTDHDDFYTENSQSDVELGNIDMPNAENLEQDIIGNLLKGTLPI